MYQIYMLKYDKKTRLCYVDTDSLIVYMKTDGIYKEITEDAQARFDTSNHK